MVVGTKNHPWSIPCLLCHFKGDCLGIAGGGPLPMKSGFPIEFCLFDSEESPTKREGSPVIAMENGCLTISVMFRTH